MSDKDVLSYFGDAEWSAYFWYISDLKIYDELKDLSDFGLNRPPQSWCYVEALDHA